jgi:hypothetical protein
MPRIVRQSSKLLQSGNRILQSRDRILQSPDRILQSRDRKGAVNFPSFASSAFPPARCDGTFLEPRCRVS